MARTRDRMTQAGVVAVVAGATAAALHRRRSAKAGRGRKHDARAALTAYLHDHLTGADAATQLVDRLQRTYGGTPMATLFASLHRRFLAERHEVETLLSDLGASRFSAKRAVGSAAGQVLRVVTGTARDRLTLFQSLEGLAIGVQGKRCMWRALQAVEPPLRAPLGTLEADAVKQWEEIERCRLELAASVLGERYVAT